MTASTLLILPLMALAAAGPLKWRLIALALAACLRDAAFVNVGSTSILAPWAVAIAFMGRFAFDLGVSSFDARLVSTVASRFTPLMLFFGWNVILIAFAPLVFTNVTETMPGSSQFKIENIVPLAQQPESINQAFYFVISVFLAGTLAIILSGDRSQIMRHIDMVVFWMFIAASATIYYHMASEYLGIPFAGDVLHSDVHSIAWKQRVEGVFRPSGAFPEPSALATFMIPFAFYYFEMFLARNRISDLAFWFSTVAVLAISTSSTAYAGLAVIGAWMAVRVMMGGARLATGFSVSKQRIVQAAVFGLIASAGLASAWLLFIDPEAAQRVIEAQVTNKSQSSSFQERNTANILAIQIFAETYGLGVGLGNHRASSVMLALVSGVGIIGTGLFVYFLAAVALRCLRSGPMGPAGRVGMHWAVATALGGQLVGMSVSSGELQADNLWMWVGAAIAMSLVPRQRRSEQMPTAPAPIPSGLTMPSRLD